MPDRSIAPPYRLLAGCTALIACLGPAPSAASASGLYRDGAGATAAGVAGAVVAAPGTPLSVLAANPAGAAGPLRPSLEAGAGVVVLDARFSNAANSDVTPEDVAGVYPELAVTLPLDPKGRWGLAFGVVPDAVLRSHWNYVDAPGGLGGQTSYGLVEQESEITVLRLGAAAAVKLDDHWSVGAALGVLYNDNHLNAPYVFQTQPQLQGFKTLLDLEADGWAVDGRFGVLYQPSARWQFGLSYRTPSRVHATGDASGNAYAQLQALGGAFAGVRPDFHYDAEVVTTFPQIVSLGGSWQFHPRWRALAQVDWINWSDAFDELPVILTDGNNADLNAFLGSNSLEDTIPLHWEDQWIGRLGLEFAASDAWTFRAGWAFGESPVPDGTLTPLTGAIFEHTLAAGAGWRRGRWSVDAAYQYSLPVTQSVGQSDLLAGEHDDSSLRLAASWFALTVSVAF